MHLNEIQTNSILNSNVYRNNICKCHIKMHIKYSKLKKIFLTDLFLKWIT